MRGVVAVLLPLALLAVAAQAAPQTAWFLRSSTYLGNRWMREGHDVRAFLTDGVIVMEGNGARLPASTRGRTLLGEVADNERIAVLERGRDHALFQSDIAGLLTLEGVRRISPGSMGYVIVALEGENAIAAALALQHAETFLVSQKPLRVVDNTRLKEKLRTHYTASPEIESLIGRISESDIYDIATYLSGEDPSSPFNSRHSMSDDSLSAGDWVQSQYRSYGFTTSREEFRDNYCSNVIGEIIGTEEPDSIVILGAHLDDREANIANVTGRAPGANDDGSGSTMLIVAAKAIYESGIRFRRTLRIMNYCGEEQGLYGSDYHATQCINNDVDVYAMLQGDMIAVQLPGEDIGVGLVNRYTDPTLMSIVAGYTAAYVPELAISYTSACCSDHQPFYEVGYASAGFVEPSGYVGDPQYHDVDDLVNRSTYNTYQLQLIAQAMLASIAELAEVV